MKRSTKIISLFLVIMIVLTGLVACGGKEPTNEQEPPVEDPQDEVVDEEETDGFPLEIEDAFGNKVTLEKAPERIISLAPSHTEILFALGLGEKIVGVTSFCDYPEEALEVEKIGDFSGMNFEKIIELEPDLIVNYGELNEDDSKVYSEAGIPVLCYIPESIDEVLETITQIALATGAVEEGESLTKSMVEKRDEIVNKVKDTEKVRVFYEIWHEPLQAAGAGSFVDGLIELANGDNVARDAEGMYPNYDMEQLIENDPEVYLTSIDVPEKTAESIAARPGYDEITAIKNGEIYLLDGNIMSRPGPRIIEALELIAKTIHPEVFE
ncbi:MAG: cobalamin-binding protein [Tissierellaceae bacterium]